MLLITSHQMWEETANYYKLDSFQRTDMKPQHFPAYVYLGLGWNGE